MKKIKQVNKTIQSDIILDISLSECLLKFGIPLPPSVYKSILHLSIKGHVNEGIFRKSSRKMRIESLEKAICNSPLNVNLRDYTNYEIADVIKRYISNIEGTIFTVRYVYLFSNLLSNDNLEKYSRMISRKRNHINSFFNLAQFAILSLPDENRDVLQIILEMLKSISNHSDINGMTIDNLAICITPSLFQLNFDSNLPKFDKKNKLPKFDMSDFEMAKNSCAFLIKNVYQLFNVPLFTVYNHSLSLRNQLSITQLGTNAKNPNDNYMMYMCTALATLYEVYFLLFVLIFRNMFQNFLLGNYF